MKGTIGAVAMFWVLAASAAEPAEKLPSRLPFVEAEAVGGRRELSGPALRGLSEQAELGVRLTVRRDADSVLGLATDYLESHASQRDEGYALGAITRELGIGVRGTIDGGGRVHAVAACGVSVLQTELAATYAMRTWRSKEEGLGLWYSLGLRVPVSSRIVAGVDVRQTLAGASRTGHSIPANGFHVTASLGVRIGATGTVAR